MMNLMNILAEANEAVAVTAADTTAATTATGTAAAPAGVPGPDRKAGPDPPQALPPRSAPAPDGLPKRSSKQPGEEAPLCLPGLLILEGIHLSGDAKLSGPQVQFLHVEVPAPENQAPPAGLQHCRRLVVDAVHRAVVARLEAEHELVGFGGLYAVQNLMEVARTPLGRSTALLGEMREPYALVLARDGPFRHAARVLAHDNPPFMRWRQRDYTVTDKARQRARQATLGPRPYGWRLPRGILLQPRNRFISTSLPRTFPHGRWKTS